MKDIGEIKSNRVKCVNTSAVYFLFNRGQLVYIGQTLNLYVRIGDHRSESWFKWDSFSYIETHPEDLYVHEAQYIKKFDPTCNRSLRCSLKNKAARNRANQLKKPRPEVNIDALVEKMASVDRDSRA
jgi:hypothetical protein